MAKGSDQLVTAILGAVPAPLLRHGSIVIFELGYAAASPQSSSRQAISAPCSALALDDGREVVIKAFRPGNSIRRLTAVVETQNRLVAEGVGAAAALDGRVWRSDRSQPGSLETVAPFAAETNPGRFLAAPAAPYGMALRSRD